MDIFLFLILMFVLGVESGASFPWSEKWQRGLGLPLAQVPEMLSALILSGMAIHGYFLLGIDLDMILKVGFWHFHFGLSLGFILFIIISLITYAGIQSATWLFLHWTTYDNPDMERTSTTKPLVDLLAYKIGGWKLGEEGYAWTACALKGLIITLPFGGLGVILFPLGYEIGSHARGRVDKWFNPHIIAEGLSFIGLGISILIFILVCGAL